MYDTIPQTREVMELDFRRLLGALAKRAWLIAVVTAFCAAVSFLGTLLLVTPKYQSSVMFYVNNNSMSYGEGAAGITSSDISASQSLVSTYIVILDTWETMTDVINHSGVNRSYEELTRMVSAEAVADTQVFRVQVTSPDPQEAWEIAQAIARVLPQRISGIIEGTSAQMVDSALVAAKPCEPNYFKNTMIGLALGFALSAGTILLLEIFDVRIRSEEDAESICTVLTTVRKGKPGTDSTPEGYKQLCTKLRFCFADENPCRVIGIAGIGKGEGKTASAAQLAQTMAALGSRVLLMECDMRRPSLAGKLSLKKTAGLADYLACQSPLEGLIQTVGPEGMQVLWAGRPSPTPVELLGSARMEKLIAQLRREYDYILLDLPNIGENSDALAVSGFVDGILLGVRHKRSSRVALTGALGQFGYTGARVLGLIYHGHDRKNSR